MDEKETARWGFGRWVLEKRRWTDSPEETGAEFLENEERLADAAEAVPVEGDAAMGVYNRDLDRDKIKR